MINYKVKLLTKRSEKYEGKYFQVYCDLMDEGTKIFIAQQSEYMRPLLLKRENLKIMEQAKYKQREQERAEIQAEEILRSENDYSYIENNFFNIKEDVGSICESIFLYICNLINFKKIEEVKFSAQNYIDKQKDLDCNTKDKFYKSIDYLIYKSYITKRKDQTGPNAFSLQEKGFALFKKIKNLKDNKIKIEQKYKLPEFEYEVEDYVREKRLSKINPFSWFLYFKKLKYPIPDWKGLLRAKQYELSKKDNETFLRYVT